MLQVLVLGGSLLFSGCLTTTLDEGKPASSPEYLILRGAISRETPEIDGMTGSYFLKTSKDTYLLHPSKNITLEELAPFDGKAVVVFGAFITERTQDVEVEIPLHYTGLVFQAFDVKE